MKRIKILFVLKFFLAFCSIAYELVLAQALSAFLENTVLRYSITIGLYMCSMGFGALAAEGRLAKRPILTLLRVEILLTVLGGFSLVLLHSVDMLNLSRVIFSVFAYGLIILIGLLTGFELPLFMRTINKDGKYSENIVLAVDYAGALAGTIIFAFVFYPKIGLMPTAFFVGLLNSMAGLVLYAFRSEDSEGKDSAYDVSLYIQVVLFMLMIFCLVNSYNLSNYFIIRYMG